MGFIFGYDFKSKTHKEYNKTIQIRYGEKVIKLLMDSILSPEKETLNNITELLLYDNIDESLKMGFIKDAIKDYLKKDVDDY